VASVQCLLHSHIHALRLASLPCFTHRHNCRCKMDMPVLAFASQIYCGACSIHKITQSSSHHCCAALHTGTIAGAGGTLQFWLLRLRSVAVPAPFTRSRTQAHTIAALLHTQAQLPVQGALFSSGFCVSDLLQSLLHSHDHALKLTPILRCFTHRHNCRCRGHSSVPGLCVAAAAVSAQSAFGRGV